MGVLWAAPGVPSPLLSLALARNHGASFLEQRGDGPSGLCRCGCELYWGRVCFAELFPEEALQRCDVGDWQELVLSAFCAGEAQRHFISHC